MSLPRPSAPSPDPHSPLQRVAVTGTSGFIGQAVLAELKRYYDVVALRRPWGPDALAGCDALVHLAGKNHDPELSDADYETKNITPTRELLAAATGKRIVLASSRMVYDPAFNALPFGEVQECRPATPYGRSKVACEAFALDQGGIALRFAQVVGAMTGGHLPDVLAARASRGTPLEVWGSGNGARDYVDLRDVVAAILTALERQDTNGIFNIGGGHAIQHQDVARAVQRHFQCAPPMRLHDKPSDEQVWQLDITRAREVLTWEPEHDLDSMIAALAAQHERRPTDET